LVELIEDESDESDGALVLLPEGYQKPISPYAVVRLVNHAQDCEIAYAGEKLLIPTSMMIEASCGGRAINLIQENYVLAVLS
jgi:hypothetical protein